MLSNGSAKFDLNVTVIPRVRHEFQSPESYGMTMIWEYNSDLFEPDTIARMIDHFQTLLEGIVANPDRCISELPILSERERHQLLIEWKGVRERICRRSVHGSSV